MVSRKSHAAYRSGKYWAERSDLLYYRYVDYVMRVAAAEARSVVDVGTGGCPYLEWFDWIPERVSFDLAEPYRSPTVTGIAGELLTHEFGRRFDVCTCLQVLEHVPEPEPFARRLLELAPLVIVSVPHRWPEKAVRTHIHDPVTAGKLEGWMGRKPNWSMVVTEPFRVNTGSRLIALYHEDAERRFGKTDVRARRVRDRAV